MTTVLDKATGQPIDLPDSQIADAWKGGHVQLVAGKAYQLKLADGTYAHATPEHIAGAIDKGASFASRDEAQAQANAEKYGGVRGMAEAAGAGAVSQGTLGVADELLPDSWKQDIAKAQQTNPISTMVGQAGGALALAAATGGAGAAEELGAGAAARVGITGESVLGRVAQRALAQGARGAFEGAQQGVAQAVSDDAFSNHKQTAENVLSTIGTNALWGGALGSALGGLTGAVGRRLVPEAEAAEAPRFGAKSYAGPELAEGAPKVSATDADIAKVAANAAGFDQPAEGLGAKMRAWYAKVAGAASGKDPDAIARFTGEDGYANRQALTEADATRDQAMRDIRHHGDAVMQASKDVQEIWDRGMKRSFIKDAVADVDADAAAERAKSLSDHVITKLSDMADRAEEFGGEKPIANTLKVANDISHKLDAAIAARDVGEIYGLTDDLKKAVGKPTAKAARLDPRAMGDELASMQVSARQKAWQDMYATVQVGLEDSNVWGKMGDAQKSVNQAYSGLIDARQRFNSALTTDIGRDPNNPWAKSYGIDPSKVGGYVRGLVEPEKDLTHKAVKDYLTNTKLLADTFAKQFDLPASKLASVSKIGESAQAFQDTLAKAEKSLTLVNQFEHLRDMASGNGTAFAAVAGTMAHGVTGGIAGMAIGKLARTFTRPADTIMQLATVEKLARQSEGRVGRALSGFARGGQKAVSPPELSSYARKAAEVQRAVTDPSTLATRIGGNLGDLRTRAPKLADAMTETALSGLALLRDKMPPAIPGDPMNPNAKPPMPPPAQREQWLRYYHAVKDPDGVVDDLRDGRLSIEGVEVLQQVYPEKYASIQRTTFDAMANGKLKNLTHQQRIGLGMMLQLPTDNSLDPSYILARQSAFQAPQAAGAPDQQQGPSDKPHKPINLAKTSPKTAVERVEQGPSSG